MGQPRLHLPGGHTILLRKTSSKVRVEPIKYRNHPAYAAFSSKQVTAVKPIAKGKTIGFYGGRIVPGDAPWNVYQMRLRKIGRGQWSVDAQEEDEDNAMRYVNDAKGMDLEPNAQFFDDMQHVIEGKYAIPELQALRNIEPGEEILVSYGPEYWKEVEEAYCETNPFACSDCNYRTDSKAKLDAHKMRKKKEKPVFSCEFCERTFASPRMCREHTNAEHTQSNLYYCNVCPFTTYRKLHLWQHTQRNHNSEAFLCWTCNGEFKTNFELQKHIQYFHRKLEQPWLKCELCGFSSQLPSSMRRHRRQKHKDGREGAFYSFPCNLCGFGCQTQGTLDKHIEKYHS